MIKTETANAQDFSQGTGSLKLFPFGFGQRQGEWEHGRCGHDVEDDRKSQGTERQQAAQDGGQ